MADGATCQVVVMIPKEGVEFRGIGLVEVIWKTAADIINQCIGTATKFHNVFHGFHVGQ